MNKGIIYIVVGERRFLEECLFSVAGLKKFCPDIGVTLFTDKTDVPSTYFDDIKLIDNDINPFKNKVKYMYDSPYEYTLFLDSDTEIRQPIYELFELLDEHDLALAYSVQLDRSRFPTRLISYADPNPYNKYNTGVVLYKKSDNLERFFAKWLDEVMAQDGKSMRSGNKGDQYYFNKLVSNKYHVDCNLKIASFSNKIYNARGSMIGHLQRNGEIKQVKILHCHDLHKSWLIRQYRRINGRVSRDLFNFNRSLRKFSEHQTK